MALLDNRYVQVALVAFAVYMFMEMQKSSTEHLDTVVNVSPEGTQVSVGQETIASVPAEGQTTVLVKPSYSSSEESAAQSLAPVMSSTVPAVTSTLPQSEATQASGTTLASVMGPSQIKPTGEETGPVAPLTAISEQLLAAAPKATGTAEGDLSAFTAEALDSETYDQIFDRNNDLSPSDLIPKTDPGGLYSDIKADPAYASNFLTNAWQMGIETASDKRNFIQDPRKVYTIPQSIVSPWLNPSGPGPDVVRRSFADIE